MTLRPKSLLESECARPECELICPVKFFDVFGEDFFRTIADGYHAHHTRNPDENTENRHSGTESILRDRLYTRGESITKFHKTKTELT